MGLKKFLATEFYFLLLIIAGVTLFNMLDEGLIKSLWSLVLLIMHLAFVAYSVAFIVKAILKLSWKVLKFTFSDKEIGVSVEDIELNKKEHLERELMFIRGGLDVGMESENKKVSDNRQELDMFDDDGPRVYCPVSLDPIDQWVFTIDEYSGDKSR